MKVNISCYRGLAVTSLTHAYLSAICLQAVLEAKSGGHSAPLHSLQSVKNLLFSGDRLGVIKVWDMTTGALGQTLEAHHNAVLNMVPYMEVSWIQMANKENLRL